MTRFAPRALLVLVTALTIGAWATPSLAARADRAPYGVTADGRSVDVFTLANDNGMRVKVLSYGGVIAEISVPDRHGAQRNVVLGLKDLKAYEARANFSSLLGRYANRISGGGFMLDGVRYDLSPDRSAIVSHGGAVPFSTRVWTGETFVRRGQAGVVLHYVSPDGEAGFPGRSAVDVTYRLTADNRLRLEYKAVTDRPTVVNLSHHVYFNLGEGQDVRRHTLKVIAKAFTPIDARKLPTGVIAPVAGTALDFRQPATIGVRLDQDDAQLKLGNGLDHNFVLDGSRRGRLALAARLADPESGRVLELRTTQPGVQVFTAGSFNGSLIRDDGRPLVRNAGVALETQHFADSPNQPAFPSTVLRPGQIFRATTEFRFYAR